MCNSYMAIIVIVIIFIFLYRRENIIQENWEIYKQKQYDYVKTGSDPLNFYVRNRYRKPYRFPYQFEKTAPFKHMAHLD